MKLTVGCGNLRTNDLDKILSFVTSNLTIVDSKSVCGIEHLYQAATLSLSSHDNGFNLSKDKSTEVLLYLTSLRQISKALKLEVNELIHLHSKNTYMVYFLGFMPGFPYLSGLNPRLHYQRKEKPKVNVPKGSVGIGGKQTGIYTTDSPGGWHIIGSTPINLFDSTTSPPCFIKPGDIISFKKIDSDFGGIIVVVDGTGSVAIDANIPPIFS